MAINYDDYAPSHDLLYVNQMRRGKNSKFKYPKLVHAFMGLLMAGFFLGIFNDVEESLSVKFGFLQGEPPSDILYNIPNFTNLSQKHGKSAYDIEGDIGQKSKVEIKINRKNKRNNDYLIKQKQLALLAEKQQQIKRQAQIERITKQAILNQPLVAKKVEVANKQYKQAKIDENLNTDIKQKFAIKKTASIDDVSIRKFKNANLDKLLAQTKADDKKAVSPNIAIIPPMTAEVKQDAKAKQQIQIASLTPISKLKPTQILSDAEIANLKAEVNRQIEMNMSEQDAPMPSVYAAPDIHSGTLEPETVDLLLAQVTAKAHETETIHEAELDWVTDKVLKPAYKGVNGKGKSSSIKRQIANIKKLSPINIVKGKIATKEHKTTVNEIRMARVNVPAPLKRPKYSPKGRVYTQPQTSGRTALTCLTTALYHEVRGESRSGQLAVAEVILARKNSRSYPNSICGVIYQNAHKRNACQFSFACDGKTDLPRDLKTWAKMKRLAGDFLSGRAGLRSVRGATHYHATYVSPKWRWAMRRITRIGTHIFYKDPKVRS